MCEKPECKDALTEAIEVYNRIKGKLQKRHTAASKSEMMTLEFFVVCVKEALLYRLTELAATAIDLYQRNAVVSAATITRSLLETTALLERLREQCACIITKYERRGRSDKLIKQFTDGLEKITFGSTDQTASVKPFKPKSLIKSLGHRLDFNAYGGYVSLCQMAHPSFQGCVSAFMEWNKEQHCVEFIRDYHHSQPNTDFHKTILAIALHIVETLEAEIAALLPKFTEVVEEYRRR